MNEYLWPHARTLPVRRDRTLRWTFSFFCFGCFLFFGLNCPAVAFGHFSLFLVEFVLLFMLYFFLERRCATAFKICTAFDILINHASRRMSHSQSVGTGHKGGWVLKEGLSHCELNFKQAKWEAKQHLLSKSARSKRFKKEAANSDNRQQDWKRKNEEKNDNKNMPNVKYPFSFILVKNVLRIYIANRYIFLHCNKQSD